MKNNELACAMERNYITQFRLLSGINGATFVEGDVFTEFVSGYQTSWMNGILETNGSTAELSLRITETLRKYTFPMTWRVGAMTSEPQIVKEALIANGLRVADTDPGMVLDRGRFSRSSPLPEFTVQLVDKIEKIEDWLIPFADAYALSSDVKNHFQVFMQNRVEDLALEGWFTGYADGLPVCSAYYLTDNEVTMIYAVGTLTGYRQRGYARRIVEDVIDHAWQHTSFPIGLYASEMGHSLYRDMGFVDVASVEQYHCIEEQI
jgi:GNAT superfamily N-acetyltransferase